jgi:hypothetical protein
MIVFGGALYLMSQMEPTTSVSIDGTATKKTGLASFFPFLGGGVQPPAVVPVASDEGFSEPDLPQTTQVGTDALFQLSTRPVAGLTILPALDTTNTTSTTHSALGATLDAEKLPRVRFVEQGTGTVYETTTAPRSPENRLTSTVIARSAHAVFADKGQVVAIRFIKNDNTTVGAFLGKVTPGTTTPVGTLEGSFLPDGIVDITASPDEKSFAYIIESESGSVGMTMRSDGSSKKQLFQSLLSEWLLDWKTGGINVTSKASSGIPGYTYAISGTGVFQKILGGISGLTTNLAPNGKKILYATATTGVLDVKIRTIANDTDVSVQLATFPEKCVWNSKSTFIFCAVPQNLFSGTHPDSWYQGAISFNDAVWKIDATTGVTTRLTTGSEALIDATSLALDINDRFLVFINKNDNTLWVLDTEKAFVR